jgi:hypothetical protein
MSNNKCPCLGCVPPKRNADCHSNCQEYKDWSIAQQQRNQEIRKAKEEENVYELLSIKRCRGGRRR